MMLLWLLLAGAGLLVLGYGLGRRRNLALLVETAGRLEAGLSPREKEYTWLGGLVGFAARYEGVEHYRSVEATLALLPRHAALFLPVSYLVFRGDRLFLLGRLSGRLRGELHLVAPSSRQRSRIERERNLTPEAHGDVWILASNPAARSLALALTRDFAALGAEHLAVVPDQATVFVLQRTLGQAEAAARLLAKLPAMLSETGLLEPAITP